VKKKHLRRALRAADERATILGAQITNARVDREEIAEALAAVGYVRVSGLRTREDELRCARAGVIVLDDVQILAIPDFTLERDEPAEFSRMGASLLAMPGPLHARLRLEFETDPEILDALGEHLEMTVGRPSVPGGRIQP
jgi:hypothetical protein